MIAYRHVTTYGVTQQRWLSSIADLAIAEAGGETILLAATQIGGGLSSYRIGAADEAITALRNRAYPEGTSYRSDPELTVLKVGGADMVHLGQLGGLADQAVELRGHNGALTAFERIFDGALGGRLTALGQIETDRGQIVFSALDGGLTLRTHRLDAEGRLTAAGSATLPVPAGTTDAHLDQILVATVGDTHVLVTLSGNGNFLSTHVMGSDGRLSGGEVYSAAQGAGFDLPSVMSLVEFGGRSFVVMGAAGSSSLTVFRIGTDGSLDRADHVLDEGNTRFQGVGALETVIVGGRPLIFVGGADDGITVLTMLPDGRLVHLATLADTAGMTLADISGISAIVIDGKVAVFVSSATETGLTQLVFDPGAPGVTRFVTTQTGNGGVGNDILQATAATRRLNGGSGDDILVAGRGTLTLHGGSGADIFMPTAIRGRIAILDYRSGTDRIDFSLLGTIRSVAQLSFVPTQTGILIIYGETILEITSADGRSLHASDFSNAMFPLAHYNLPEITPGPIDPDDRPSDVPAWLFGTPGHDRLLGASAPERIVAGLGDDTVSAGAGHDTVRGDGGRDVLRGGAGNDRLSGGDDRDLLFGDAGDDSLEGDGDNDTLYGGAGGDTVLGGSGRDLIYGGDGDDRLDGGAGNDTLSGEAGNDRIEDLAGNNRLLGGSGNDTLIAGGGADYLAGGAGRDSLKGGGGHDTLWAGGGNDILLGEAGNDVLQAQAGANRLYGGNGNDLLFGGTGRDRMFGGAGQDRLHAGMGGSVMSGGTGNDRLWGRGGNDRMLGDAGNDRLVGNNGHDTLNGGAGDDLIQGGNGNDLLMGGSGRDRLFGGGGHDSIADFSGDNHLSGGGGNDTIRAGGGRDTLSGDGGNDLLSGGAGNDRLIGGAGRDRLDGQQGNDALLGGAGNDVLLGGAGHDALRGGGGTDRLSGGAGRDGLWGDAGHDRLLGGGGNDRLMGGGGNDHLSGQQGQDRLWGHAGNDTLAGNLGADVMTGGPGRDQFRFFGVGDSRPGAADVITDFTPDQDLLDLRGMGLDYDGSEFSGRNSLIWRHTARETHVMVDSDGDGRSDMLIRLSGHLSLDGDDFLL